jgi:mRNA interferase MazF
MPWIPERGDIVWITMNHTVGHEQSGRRPALVLSPAAYNGKVGLAILCPITSQVKGYPFDVQIPEGLPVEGVVLADQAKSLDWRARGAELLCTVPQESTSAVLQRLETLVSP